MKQGNCMVCIEKRINLLIWENIPLKKKKQNSCQMFVKPCIQEIGICYLSFKSYCIYELAICILNFVHKLTVYVCKAKIGNSRQK